MEGKVETVISTQNYGGDGRITMEGQNGLLTLLSANGCIAAAAIRAPRGMAARPASIAGGPQQAGLARSCSVAGPGGAESEQAWGR
jgi:hypothetical protein